MGVESVESARPKPGFICFLRSAVDARSMSDVRA